MTATSIIVVLLVLVVAVIAAPWIAEALRKPVSALEGARMPGEFAELGDGITHYKWHGSRADRVIVLVPGLTSPSWVFQGLIRELLKMDYRVLTYDLYGRGFSDRVGAPQTLDLHARQLGQLLNALGEKGPVSILGYSMGGAIAARFAATESDMVDRLVLVAPAGMGHRPTNILGKAVGAGPFGSWLWGMFGPRVLRRQAAVDAKKPGALPDLRARIDAELGRRGYLAAVLSSERHALAESVEDDHHEIAAMYIPTLVIWAEADEVIPISGVGKLASWNRQAHQEVIPGADHAVIYTEPGQVLDALRDFLREVPD